MSGKLAQALQQLGVWYFQSHSRRNILKSKKEPALTVVRRTRWPAEPSQSQARLLARPESAAFPGSLGFPVPRPDIST